jgi:hypothetical protein
LTLDERTTMVRASTIIHLSANRKANRRQT